MNLEVLYSKAYTLKELRSYKGWEEVLRESEKPTQEIHKLRDDDLVFIHQDYSVTIEPRLGQGVIYDKVNSEWKRFCEETLQFECDFA